MPIPHKTSSIILRLALWSILAVTIFATLAALLTDRNRVAAMICSLPPSAILAILAAVLFNYTLRFVKWHFFLTVLQIRIPFKTSLWVFFAAFTMILSPGKIGELIKSLLLQSRCGIEIPKTAPIVLAERITDLAGLLILCLISLGSSDFGTSTLLITAIAVVAGILTVSSSSFWNGLGILLRRHPKFSRLSTLTETLQKNTETLFSRTALFISVPLSALSWAGEGLALYIIFINLGCEIPSLLTTSIFAHSFSSIAGALSFLPGGLLVTEGAMTTYFFSVNIPDAMAVSATIMIRSTTLWFAVIIGTVVFLSGCRKGDLVAEIHDDSKKVDNQGADNS